MFAFSVCVCVCFVLRESMFVSFFFVWKRKKEFFSLLLLFVFHCCWCCCCFLSNVSCVFLQSECCFAYAHHFELLSFTWFKYFCFLALFFLQDRLVASYLFTLILLVSMLMCVLFSSLACFNSNIFVSFALNSINISWNLITIRGVKKKHWNIKCLNLFSVFSLFSLNFIYARVCVFLCECVISFLSFVLEYKFK